MKIPLKFINLVLVILIIWVGTYLFLASKKPLSFVAKTPVPTIYVAPTRIIIPAPTAVILSSDKLFQLVNDWRVQNGYQPYLLNESLCIVARERIPEIKIKWSHEGLFNHLSEFNYVHYGENLGKGYRYANDESRILKDWVNSPEHYENLILPFTDSCIESNDGYVVQLFADF